MRWLSRKVWSFRIWLAYILLGRGAAIIGCLIESRTSLKAASPDRGWVVARNVIRGDGRLTIKGCV
jgi:hypothetical protein